MPAHPPHLHVRLGPPTARHEYAPAKGVGDTRAPGRDPPSHQHPPQLPATQGQLQRGAHAASPPNEAANEGGALISGGAALPLWRLGRPPAPSPPGRQPPLCAATALPAATRSRGDTAISAGGYLMAGKGVGQLSLGTGRHGAGPGQAAPGHHSGRRGEWPSAICLSVCLPPRACFAPSPRWAAQPARRERRVGGSWG